MNAFTGMTAVMRLERARDELREAIGACDAAGMKNEAEACVELVDTVAKLHKHVQGKVIAAARRSGMVDD